MADVADKYVCAVIAWAAVIEQPSVLTIVMAEAVFHAEFFTTVECCDIDIQAALKVVRMYSFSPTVARLLRRLTLKV